MDKHPPIIIVDSDDALRSALERLLRRKDQEVIAKPADETCDSEAWERGRPTSTEGGAGRKASEGTGKILFELPSDLALLDPITDYLTKRVEQIWSMPAGTCIDHAQALREALINAIKHGNHSDRAKRVRITVQVLDDEAKFTVEDEGVGFDANDVPPPRDPENLFKSSGRGVLLIKSIMDETQYNDRGNRLTMVKKRASLFS